MNELKTFNNQEFGEVRTVIINEEAWFVAKDVCTALELKNPTMVMQRLDNDERAKFNLGLSGGETNCVNEYGLYNLILVSRKKEAKKFKRWITHEVLPEIRKTGSYKAPMTTSEQIRLLAQGSVELEKRVDSIENKIEEVIENELLTGYDCDRIISAKNRRACELMGGYGSPAYRDSHLRYEVYADFSGEIRRQYGVSSYKGIKRKETDGVLTLISNYNLPKVLAEKVANTNAQISFQ